jgi:hypothetical protein
VGDDAYAVGGEPAAELAEILIHTCVESEAV